MPQSSGTSLPLLSGSAPRWKQPRRPGTAPLLPKLAFQWLVISSSSYATFLSLGRQERCGRCTPHLSERRRVGHGKRHSHELGQRLSQEGLACDQRRATKTNPMLEHLWQEQRPGRALRKRCQNHSSLVPGVLCAGAEPALIQRGKLSQGRVLAPDPVGPMSSTLLFSTSTSSSSSTLSPPTSSLHHPPKGEGRVHQHRGAARTGQVSGPLH